MSKIQDALRKIQSVGKTADSDRPERPEQIATVVLETLPSDTKDGGEVADGRRVIVDRQLLQMAGLMPPEAQLRYVADQFRLIKRPILDLAMGNYAEKPEHANLVMIASALPGDGKTFNAISIALSIAVEKDTSVLLVDADVAKPHISNLFGLAEEPGLIDLLDNQNLTVSDAVLRTDVPGLSLLPAGHINENATELLASRRMAAVAHELAQSDANRIVIFDSPPLLATSESRVLASQMGQIALVVCAGKTPRNAVQDAIESLDSSKAINLILNQAGGSSGDGYYGGYHYGYGATTSE